jgi:hypothetical protein
MLKGLFLLALAHTLTSEGFYPIGENHGVKVFRRDGGGGIELGAEGDIDAPPEVVLRVLTDYANHPKWVRNLSQSRVIDKRSNSLDVYQTLHLPVLSDRDFTLHVTWGDQGDAKWLRFRTANDKGPPPGHGAVRVNLHEGSWLLEPRAGGQATHAVYQFHLDLSGSFPGWMGKGQAGKDMPNLFENIRNQTRYYK